MGIVLILAAMAVSVVLGFVLGSIPGLNEHLHWNLWYIIPISGLLFGALCGGIQFLILFYGNQRASLPVKVFLVISAVAGYFAVDFGIYRSGNIQIIGESNETSSYPYRDLVTFGQYLKIKLGANQVELLDGQELELESGNSSISFAADLLGAALGSLVILFACSEMYPYCVPCKKYKKYQRQYLIEFAWQPELLHTILSHLQELGKTGITQDIAAYCAEQQRQHQLQDGDGRIQIEQKACPVCAETTFIGAVKRKSEKGWVDLNELRFRFTSKPQDRSGTIEDCTQFMRGI